MYRHGDWDLVFGQPGAQSSGFWSGGHLEELVVAMAVLAVLVAVAAYAVSRIRSQPVQQERAASDLISDFRAARDRGRLSEEEFRTIKTMLAQELSDELSDEDETG
ncbi:MAG: hypothetical protein ACOC46_02210 [Pirellulales bacterium]